MKNRHRAARLSILVSVAAAIIGIALYLWRLDSSDRQRPNPEGAQGAGAPRQPSLAGVVTSCYGEPVADAVVRLVVESRDYGSARVDEDGAFSFDGIHDGPYELRVESETWGSLKEEGTLNPGSDRRVRLRISGRARVDGRIGGNVVVQAEGVKPRPAVESLGPVRLFRVTDSGRELLVGDVGVVRNEDVSATFAIRGLGVGQFVLEVRTGRGALQREFEVERNGQVVAIEFTLRDGRPNQQRIIVVHGTAYLTDKETSPLASRLLEVDVVRPGGVASGPPRQVYTDAQGAYRFRIRALERGTILRYSYPQAQPVVAEIEGEPGEDVRFDPDFGLFPLERVGILTTTDGVPVANSRVILHHNTRWTDNDGIFSLDGVGKGSHEVDVWYNRYGRDIVSVTASLAISTGPRRPEAVALEIDVENAVCIQVLDYSGQRPGHGVVRYALTQQELGAGSETYYQVAFRRPGRIFLAGLPYSGDLHLAARGHHRSNKAGRPPVMPTYSTLEVGLEDLQPPKVVLLQLEGSRFRSVRLIGGDDQPLSGAFATVGFSYVRPRREAGIHVQEGSGFQVSHPHEALAIQALVATSGKGAGAYALVFFDKLEETIGIFHPDGATVITRSEGESLLSATPPITIRLGVAGFVVGTVQDSQGEPVSGCRVELRLAGGEKRSAETFPNGNYFLYAGDDATQQLAILPGDGSEITIEAPVAGVMEVIRLE